MIIEWCNFELAKTGVKQDANFATDRSNRWGESTQNWEVRSDFNIFTKRKAECKKNLQNSCHIFSINKIGYLGVFHGQVELELRR